MIELLTIKFLRKDIKIRIDKYLKSIHQGLTQGVLEKLLRKRKILVNNNKSSSSYILKYGDIVTYPKYLENFNSAIKIDSSITSKIVWEKILNNYLISDTKDYLVINKPNKIATQGGSKVSHSINDALNYANINIDYFDKYRLVHRLDKDTSGLLFIAKGLKPASILTSAFKERLIEKYYLAITKGDINKDKGVIINNEIISIDSFNKNKVSGNDLITKFELLEKSGEYNLIKFNPISGKKHQIRKHSLLLGGAIIGDKKYLGEKNTNMMLHSYESILNPKLFNKQISYKATIPKYFSDFLKYKNLK